MDTTRPVGSRSHNERKTIWVDELIFRAETLKSLFLEATSETGQLIAALQHLKHSASSPRTLAAARQLQAMDA
ncbi:MAG: hypothetical protein N2C12_16565 [Planctomycetales bacterium]